MRQYRKRPVIIEAVLYDGSEASFDEIWRWMDGDKFDSPMGGYEGPDDAHPGAFSVETLEGRMRAEAGDWIIKGIKGDFYPCKPDIFALTYEQAET